MTLQGVQLWPEEPRVRGDEIEVSAVLEGVRGKRTPLTFRLPVEEREHLTSAADPFVLASAFHLMEAGTDLEVHGAVSPSLLCGLEEVQAAWQRWKPDRYRPFSVQADLEREEAREPSGRTVMTFSGGLDSCCTAWRHTRGDLGRRRRKIEAAVMVHGFDIPLEQDEVFKRAVETSRTILGSIGIPVVPMVSNIRTLGGQWEDVHGAALAACLHLLAGGYSTGLVASSHVYETLRFPWGSNPVTDPMLSSAAFSIVQDGCELTRWEKADEVGDWEAAHHHLRLCWEGEHLDRNCGSCMRCVGTAFCFAAVGRPIPPSIPIPSPAEALRRLRALEPSPVQLGHFENMVAEARRRALDDPWVAALDELVRGRQPVAPKRGLGAWAGLRRRLRLRP